MSLAAETLLSQFGAHPYLLLFPLVLVEGPLVTLCAGILVAAGLMRWPLAYALAVTADLTGDTLYYVLGRFGHRPCIRRFLARLGVTEARLANLEGALAKNLVSGPPRTPLTGWSPRWDAARALMMLRRRAYSPARFERLVAESSFRTCDIQTEGIGMEVRLKKRDVA